MYQVSGVPFTDYDNAIRSGYKQRLRITFPNQVFDEQDIYSDGIEYNEILNSDTDMTFGKAVCSSVKIPLINVGDEWSDFNFQQRFTVELGVTINNEVVYAPLGTFIGEKPKRVMDDTVELIGYDLMTLFDTDAKRFLESLVYPKTIGQIFNLLCSHIGVTGNSTGALNLSRQISASPFGGEGTTCREILGWIAEACGCYARMSRDGVCELVWFGDTEYSVNGYQYFNIDIDEVTVPQIDQVRIQVTENDIGVSYPSLGTFNNSYPVYDNPYLYASDSSELTSVAQNLYERVSLFGTYKPCNVNVDGDWLLQCGDIIHVVAMDDTEVVNLPIYSLTLKWYGRAEITYQSTGSEEREPFTTATKARIRENYRMHEFTVTLEEFKSEIINSTSRTFIMTEDPTLTEDVSVGDFWIIPGLDTWGAVKQKTWGEVKEYTWKQLFAVTKVWSGSEWIAVSDTGMMVEQASKIEQTDKKITLEVRRANAAEGELKSSIEMTSESLSLEVSRATMAEETLRSSIEMTDSKLALEVSRATMAEETLRSSIEITDSKLALEVSRATQAEGTLQSSITLTDGKITAEVTRAKGAEGTLQSNIEQTAEDIRLGVKSVGKVDTVGSYIQISSKNVTVNSGGTIDIKSGGDINIKSGGTFTVAGNNFKIDASGNVTMSGKVTATDGEIAGWKITATTLTGNKTGLAKTTNDSDIAIWAGNSTASSANFYVTQIGDVVIKRGSISIGGTSASPNFSVSTDGDITIKRGSIDINSSSFAVDSSGNVTIKRGSIDINSGNFNVDSSGNVTIKRGSITIGSNFAVTSSGSLTAKDGEIAGWTIGTSALSKLVMSGTSVSSHVGMASSGTYAFYAGQNASASDCAFKVSKEGKVWLTKLFARSVDTSAPGYNEDDPSTWTWIDSEVDLGNNGYKIGSGYCTVASYNSSTGKVRLSDGRSFNTATSVKVTGGWSGNQYAYRAYYTNSSGTQIDVATGTSETVGTGFIAQEGGRYYVHSFYSIATAPYYVDISSFEYNMVKNGSYVELQNTSGTRIDGTPQVSVTTYSHNVTLTYTGVETSQAGGQTIYTFRYKADRNSATNPLGNLSIGGTRTVHW